MPKLIRPPDKNDATAFLRMLFLRTEQRLLAEIRRKRSQGYVDYAGVAALKRTRQILQDMVDESWAVSAASTMSPSRLLDSCSTTLICVAVRPAALA